MAMPSEPTTLMTTLMARSAAPSHPQALQPAPMLGRHTEAIAEQDVAGAGCGHTTRRAGSMSSLLRASVPLLSLEDDPGLKEILRGWGSIKPWRQHADKTWARFNLADLHDFRRAARHAGVQLPLGGTCAVVGSSSALWDTAHGKEIDAADVVWRMNNAPVSPRLEQTCKRRGDLAQPRCNGTRWEQHIGRRTSVYLNSAVAVHNAVEHGKRNSSAAALDSAPMHITYCPTRNAPYWGPCFSAAAKLGYDTVSPNFEALVRREHCLTQLPSMGLLALMLADALCSETRMYGFGKGQGECASYYGKCQTYEKYASEPVHDHPSEQDYFARRLARSRRAVNAAAARAAS